jgi:hypothetical protein
MAALMVCISVICFVIADIVIRHQLALRAERKARAEREAILTKHIRLDFSDEAKSLKRVELPSPKAKILAVDDEAVILDSFRKILVVAGYSVDTRWRAAPRPSPSSRRTSTISSSRISRCRSWTASRS